MPPNVLVLLVDALRADRVGVFGERNLTPQIDELAADSVVCPNAYTASNATDVAVTSLHTGRYPLSHGVVNHGSRVTENEKRTVECVPTLPELLSADGYHTATLGRGLGRWHRNGFDSYRPTQSTPSSAVKHRLGNLLAAFHPSLRETARDVYETHLSALEKAALGSDSRTDYDESDEPDPLLRTFERLLDKQTPFYAFVHLNNTHVPYIADPNLVCSYLDRFDYDVETYENVVGTSLIPDSFAERAAETRPELVEQYYVDDGTPSSAVVEAHYDAAVTEADERVGRLLSQLRNRDRLDETLVVLLSDHGESMTEHGIYFDHHGLYDVSVHIPLIFRPPGGHSATVDDLVQITDVAPTIASYTDTEGLEPDGRSLKQVIEDGTSLEREFVMAEEAHTQRRRMVRSADHKLIYLVDGDTVCRYCDVEHAPPVELYDLREDPEEQVNSADEQSKTVTRLRAYASRQVTRYRDARPSCESESDVTYDDEDVVEKRLEALGYR